MSDLLIGKHSNTTTLHVPSNKINLIAIIDPKNEITTILDWIV